MVPSVEQPAFRADSLLSRKHRSLLLMAVLGGMATAAVAVFLMAVRPVGKSHAAASDTTVSSGRPSPFGSAPVIAPDVKMTPPQVAKVGDQAVVTVTGYDANDQPLSQANGYVYLPNGIIVTSYSAIRGASSVTIETSNGVELNVIALMGYSPSRDLAVLAVLEGNLTALENGAGEPVQEGDKCMAIGLSHAIAQGTIGPRRAIGGVDLIQMNAQAIAGSPVVNAYGRVIGVAVKSPAGFAVPSHYVSDMLAEHRTMSFAQMLEETGH